MTFLLKSFGLGERPCSTCLKTSWNVAEVPVATRWVRDSDEGAIPVCDACFKSLDTIEIDADEVVAVLDVWKVHRE